MHSLSIPSTKLIRLFDLVKKDMTDQERLEAGIGISYALRHVIPILNCVHSVKGFAINITQNFLKTGPRLRSVSN
jgi:hypothetical protein